MFATPTTAIATSAPCVATMPKPALRYGGASANAESNRAMNWAEQQNFPSLLTPSPSASGTAYGYYYRYYSGTNTYRRLQGRPLRYP